MESRLAYLFPGQGSQAVGMGAALMDERAEARAVFDEADEALGFSLSTLCREGPAEDLALTANTQPAILTTSIAALRVALAEGAPKPDLAMGHSLGEFSALVAVGALRFADAVRLVRLRGEAMQAAVPAGVGAMAAVLRVDADVLEGMCKEVSNADERVTPANENGGGQIVVAGHAAAVERLVDTAKAAKGRAMLLNVSAPFHCELMRPAAEQLAQALDSIEIGPMSAPVIANVDAEPNDEPARVKSLLVQQVTGRVRWETSVRKALHMGVARGIEFGHGNVLAGLIRRIDKAFEVVGFGSPDAVDVLNPRP